MHFPKSFAKKGRNDQRRQPLAHGPDMTQQQRFGTAVPNLPESEAHVAHPRNSKCRSLWGTQFIRPSLANWFWCPSYVTHCMVCLVLSRFWAPDLFLKPPFPSRWRNVSVHPWQQDSHSHELSQAEQSSLFCRAQDLSTLPVSCIHQSHHSLWN